jgi:hypothetical protein
MRDDHLALQKKWVITAFSKWYVGAMDGDVSTLRRRR